MKPELKELFDGLNKLCELNDAFYFSEQALCDRYIIRSYTYRLASWTEFQLPFAKDCRGTAFILDKSTGEWELFTRAYRKFFNLGEIGSPVVNVSEHTLMHLDYEESLRKLTVSKQKFNTVADLINYLSTPPKE